MKLQRHIVLVLLLVAGAALGAAGTFTFLHVTGLTAALRGSAPSAPQALFPQGPLQPIVTDSPTPTPEPALRSYLAEAQIVSYYGHPASPALGVLGEGDTETMLARLRAQAAAYQALNPEKKVIPALHLIYEVAQANPGPDGLYLYRTDDATVQRYIDLARQNGMLLFLDLQIGRSSLDQELNHVMPYLKLPFVHLAIDPEFAMPPGERPGEDIGSLDALDIDAALARINAMAEQENLPYNKIVIVHQFQDSMLTNKDLLNWWEPRVDLVLDMDGYGDQSGKLGKYNSLINLPAVRHAAIKLFYQHDVALLSEQQVEELQPRPDIIIYQ